MAGKRDHVDTSTDTSNERSDEQVLNHLADVEPGKPMTEIEEDQEDDKGDRKADS